MTLFAVLAVIVIGVVILVSRSGYKKSPTKSRRNAILILSIFETMSTLVVIGTFLMMLLFTAVINSEFSDEADVIAFSTSVKGLTAFYFLAGAFGIVSFILGYMSVANRELNSQAEAQEYYARIAAMQVTHKVCTVCGNPVANNLNVCQNCGSTSFQYQQVYQSAPNYQNQTYANPNGSSAYNTQNYYAQYAQPAPTSSNTYNNQSWQCSCGRKNPPEAKFCPDCGMKHS